MVDLTKRPDVKGQVRTHAWLLLSLVPGRSGAAYAGWLNSRGAGFTDGVRVAVLDPFGGYGKSLSRFLCKR